MSAFATVFKKQEHVNPQRWWNAAVQLASSRTVGLLTGQLTIDDILNAMDDAAWKQNPS